MAIVTPQGFDLQAQEPLELKTVKQNEAERLGISLATRYDGLTVYEVETKLTYQLQGGIEDSFWVLLATGGSGETRYTNANPVPTSLGGISAGTTFTDVPLQEMWTSLLYPYQSALISLSTSPASTLYEKGYIIGSVDLTAHYTKRDYDITAVLLYRDNGLIYTVSPLNPGGGTANYTDNNQVVSHTTYKATVNDGHSVVSTTRNFSFANPYFYGSGAKGLSVAQIQQGLTKQVVNKSTKTYTFNPTNQVYYFAYPQSYGHLSSIKDTNNFETIDDWNLRSEVFNTNGSYFLDNNVPYYVYEFKNLTTQVNFKNTFKY